MHIFWKKVRENLSRLSFNEFKLATNKTLGYDMPQVKLSMQPHIQNSELVKQKQKVDTYMTYLALNFTHLLLSFNYVLGIVLSIALLILYFIVGLHCCRLACSINVCIYALLELMIHLHITRMLNICDQLSRVFFTNSG